MAIKPGKKFNAEESFCEIRNLFNHSNSNLDYLSADEIMLWERASSAWISFKYEEAMLFNLMDPCEVTVEGETYSLAHYDVLYIPLNSAFSIRHNGEDAALLNIYRATAEQQHPVHHSKWEEIKNNEDRIRHLDGKDVFLMFDVAEKADKFIAGFTFYEDYTRAWPPHNHTDQEEVYSFVEGRGAMEVYETDEQKTFVTSVETGDHVTIPMLNYHPVFSHGEPVTFIWCIAGERYWVGDKNEDFMKGKGENITT
jgi:mannose-6-phosphate isomerase-like protein (cupin superfamily)